MNSYKFNTNKEGTEGITAVFLTPRSQKLFEKAMKKPFNVAVEVIKIDSEVHNFVIMYSTQKFWKGYENFNAIGESFMQDTGMIAYNITLVTEDAEGKKLKTPYFMYSMYIPILDTTNRGEVK